MIYSATTETYNNCFIKNYNKLLKFTNNDEDRLHDCYLKVNNYISNKSFTGETETLLNEKLIVFTKTTLFNNFKTEIRLKKNNIELEELINEVDNKLLEDNEDFINCENNLKLYEYISMKLFQYIKKYPDDWQYVFRVYYLFEEKRINYNKLSKITGFSISKCCNIIQTMKADIKTNLINYINNG